MPRSIYNVLQLQKAPLLLPGTDSIATASWAAPPVVQQLVLSLLGVCTAFGRDSRVCVDCGLLSGAVAQAVLQAQDDISR